MHLCVVFYSPRTNHRLQHGKPQNKKTKEENPCDDALEAGISHHTEERRGSQTQAQLEGGVGVGLSAEGRMDDGRTPRTCPEMEEGMVFR